MPARQLIGRGHCTPKNKLNFLVFHLNATDQPMNEKKTNILLVEDEEAHAHLICRSFDSASEPVSVTVARNLNEAHSSIAKSTPDLIIVDFLLPDGKGIELIPADKEESPYPVIILTSHGDEKIAVEAMKAGAFDYIVKSEVTLDDMPHIYERIMREWRLITKRKQVEEALSKSEERYCKLVETAQDAIVCDINGIIVDWNKSAERVFGYSKDEIMGKPVNVLLPDRYKSEHQVGFDRFIKTGEARIIGKTVEVLGLTKEGVEIPIEMSLTYQRLEQEQHLFTAIIRDITERKRAERRLNAQHAVIKVLAESATVKEASPKILQAICEALEWDLGEMWIFDQQEYVLRNTEIWHIPSLKVPEFIAVTKQITFPSQIGLPGRIWESAKPLWIEDITLDTNFPRSSVAAKEGLHGAFGFPIINGREVLGTISFISREIRKPDNNLLDMMAAIGRQIGLFIKRKRSEEELQESEKKSLLLLNSTGEAIYGLDLEGNCTFCNPSCLCLLGYEHESQLLGRNMHALIHHTRKDGTPYPEEECCIYQAFREGKGTHVDDEVLWRADGTSFAAEYRSFPIFREGETVGSVVSFVDITERKKAEEEIKGLAKFPSENPNPVLRVKRKGTILFANNAASIILDYWGTQTGQSVPEDWHKHVLDVLRAGKSNNYEMKIKDHIFSITLAPVVEEGYVNFYGLDITEKKKMEEALLQSEKLKSIGTITAGISHEFNNILAIISGNVQLLEASYKDHEGLSDALRIIKRATNDGAEISRRMLKFTKTAKDTAGIVPFDINELINQAIDFTMPRWKNMAQAKGINYYMDTEGMKRVPSILCNPTELREVFVNIINNALDAMPDDGRITFRTWNGEDTVFISISDTGEGMSEEVKKRVFDPFYTTKLAVGTGLGMSTAYGIVTGHGGKIEVKSKVGRGSVFTLQFPVAAKADSPKESPEPKQEIKSNSLRILVVDDEEEICNILDKFLSKKGHLVRIVDNGREAIMLTKIDDYDLVLCDMAMPEVFGYDVIRALNKLEKRPKIGIITGWGEKLKPIDDEGLKVDFIIKKPFDFSELAKNINVAFGTE